MMDFGAIISRAFNVMIKNRALWFLGFLAALGSGTGSSFNFNVPVGGFTPPVPGTVGGPNADMTRFFDNLNSGAILAGLTTFACILALIGIALWVISLMARGGLIRGVQEIETQGSTTFGAAFSVGARKFWPILGLNILLLLPIILLVILGAILIGGSVAALIASSVGRGDEAAAAGVFGSIGSIVCIGGALACVGIIYGLIASALQTFGERAIVIDNLGVMDSIRKAWDVFRNNLGNIILLAILMFVISLVIGFIIGIIAAGLFLPVMFSGVLNASADGGLQTGTIVLGVLAFIVVLIVGAIIAALYVAFNSTLWTLAYRQFTGAAPVASTPAPAAPLPTA